IDDDERFHLNIDTHQNAIWNPGSVRMSHKYWINDGVMLANISHAPAGCVVRISWTLGKGAWTYYGEIDVLENAEFEQGARLHEQPRSRFTPNQTATSPSPTPPLRARIHEGAV
ncbi:hypothetical protein V8E36_009143, partial [Tilletia maclaganii]